MWRICQLSHRSMMWWCIHRAMELRKDWLETVPSPVDLLPGLNVLHESNTPMYEPADIRSQSPAESRGKHLRMDLQVLTGDRIRVEPLRHYAACRLPHPIPEARIRHELDDTLRKRLGDPGRHQISGDTLHDDFSVSTNVRDDHRDAVLH